MRVRRAPGHVRLGCFRLLLLGYPRGFRRAYGSELEQTFVDAWREEAGDVVSELGLWRRLLWDGLVNGMKARWSRRFGSEPNAYDGVAAGGGGMARFEGFGRDTYHAARAVVRERSVWAVVVTLALGVGAATAVFAVVDAVLLRPPSFAAPERLVQLQREIAGKVIVDHYSVPHASEVQARFDVASSVAAHARINMVLTGGGEARSVRVHATTPGLFRTLGREPARGRIFDAEETASGAPVVVLSHALWRELGGDHAMLGRPIRLDGQQYEVIGVMPPEFRFPRSYTAEAFLPLAPGYRAAGTVQDRVVLVARLREGVTLAAAAERLDVLVQGIVEGAETGWVPRLEPLAAHRANPDVTRALWLVAGAVGAMLLIAILNATNLLLARVTVRAREFAVRHSLGASSTRLLRQLITECLAIALAAGAAAVLLSVAGVRALLTIAPAALTDHAVNRIVIDGRVLSFTFGVTVATGFVLGILPALAAARAARVSIGASLSAYAISTRQRHAVRHALVVGQVALAITLLAAATLLSMSFTRLLRVDTGVDMNRTVLIRIMPNENAYPTPAARHAYGERLEEKLRALPGVDGVTRANGVPFGASFSVGAQLQADRDQEPRQDSPLLLPFAQVRPEYLEVVGAELVAGRNFAPGETPAANVAIIDVDMARFLFGADPAVGRRFRMDDGPWLTVVGVLRELMLGSPDGSRGDFAMLRPAPPELASTGFAVRTTGRATALLPAVSAAVRSVDPEQPIWKLGTPRDMVVEELARQRFFTMVMVLLGWLSLTLSALGLYSMLAFVIGRRTHELGIRMALGARAVSVLRMVVGLGVRLTAAGILLGVAGAAAATRLIESLLFEVRPGNLLSFGIVIAVMLIASLAASALPALRAARVHPMQVLRSE
jgi:putative ABC transport system permease protein